jgi:hypothetical protein
VQRNVHLRRILAALSVLVLVAAACTSADQATTFDEVSGGLAADNAAPETTVAAATATTAAPEAPEGDNRSLVGSGGVTPVLAQPIDLGRDIIFTADLVVAVTDVVKAGEEATRIVSSLGGFIFGQHTIGAPNPQSVLTFKVFPEDFQTALDRLGSIGELRSQNVSADDVTERVVDIKSRINTAEASVERLRGFLETAQGVEAVAALESQLLQRETELETLRGQLRTLEDMVSLATIVLTITEDTARPEIRLIVTAYPGHDGAGLSCPGGEGLTVDEGGPATLCFELINVGDTHLTDLALRDPILDITIDDTIVVFGDPSATIEPGQSILLAYEATAERDIRTQTTATAQPVAEDGTPLPGREAAVTVTFFIDSVDPGGIPTFTEGLKASYKVLVQLGQFLLLLAGSLLPFIWVPAVLWLAWRWQTTRRRQPMTSAPLPPASVPEPVGVGAKKEV